VVNGYLARRDPPSPCYGCRCWCAIVLAAQLLAPETHILLFALSAAAIVPLAALLNRATESVASKTGDMIGGLLNALGNLTELLIALAALRAPGNIFS
jgi:Ca2+:H+ antiporter